MSDPILDHQSPVPLYHQMAEAIRYRIATGELLPGTILPPLRRAAEAWGVNLHTVSRAYAELARLGLVATTTPGGTRILPGTPGQRAKSEASSRDDFAKAVVAQARVAHGLGLAELLALLQKTRDGGKRAPVSVVECSLTQSEDLATQLAERWRVDAQPWLLGDREPPRGTVIGTYFHYNDIRLQWPKRLPDVQFLPIAPEPGLADRLSQLARRGRGRVKVVFFEKEEEMARNIMADLLRILPSKSFDVASRVVGKASDALSAEGQGTALLFSPRVWGELSAAARRDPRVHQVRYVFDPAALTALGIQQEWETA